MQKQNIQTKSTLDLGFFTDEKLFDFFCENKTKISTIEDPLMFLHHLKDNKLITDDLFQKHKDVDVNGVYQVLEHIEQCSKKKVRKFWDCVNQSHLLELCPRLSEIIYALKSQLKGSDKKMREWKIEAQEKRKTVSNSESDQAGPSSQSTNNQRTMEKYVETAFPSPSLKMNNKTRKKSNEQDTEKEKEKAVKRMRTESNSVNNQAGLSSQSTMSQIKETEAEKAWDKPENKRWLPVTCGEGKEEKKAKLDRDALYKRKRDCIKYGSNMISPYLFEEMGGRGSSKSWKTSILCQGTTLKSLMDMGILKVPTVKGKFTLHK
ncbi:hypothetical protein QQF64_024440 [Cirrhinus molitorella]|uniref:SAND domain-containing protein n=1 Tax=Cirrhinus molitorella TaxID=172907 RepID=A0ABR3NLY8_9TELE